MRRLLRHLAVLVPALLLLAVGEGPAQRDGAVAPVVLQAGRVHEVHVAGAVDVVEHLQRQPAQQLVVAVDHHHDGVRLAVRVHRAEDVRCHCHALLVAQQHEVDALPMPLHPLADQLEGAVVGGVIGDHHAQVGVAQVGDRLQVVFVSKISDIIER